MLWVFTRIADVYTVCYFICIFWVQYSMVKPYCSNFMIITATFPGVHFFFVVRVIVYELPHDKTNKKTCAPSEDSYQPGQPPSLIRVFIVRMKKPWVLGYPLSTQRRLIRLDGCPGWSESSLSTLIILLVLSCGGSYEKHTYLLVNLKYLLFQDRL